jgi:hypothetical protein
VTTISNIESAAAPSIQGRGGGKQKGNTAEKERRKTFAARQDWFLHQLLDDHREPYAKDEDMYYPLYP